MSTSSRIRGVLLFFTLGTVTGVCGPLGDKYRLLVLITEAARPYVGSEAALTSVIREKLVEYTRQAYVNSDESSSYTMPDIELAGVLRVPYAEGSGDLNDALNRLTNVGGHLAEVTYWRDMLSADLVMLLVYDSDWSWGLAWVKSSSGKGFSVLNRASYWGYFTAAHEIGHNFGCAHRTGSLNNAYSHGRGYRSVIPNTWKSIMAPYEGSGDGWVRQQWFSNPYMFVDAEARGTTSSNNCTRVHHDRKSTVAGFRDAPSTLIFADSAVNNGEYVHLVAGTNALLSNVLISSLAETFVESPRVSITFGTDNSGKLTVDASDDAYLSLSNLQSGSITKMFAADIVAINNSVLRGKLRMEGAYIGVGGNDHNSGSESVFITPGNFQGTGDMNVDNGKVWIQAQDVLFHPNYPGDQIAFKFSNNSEALIAAGGKVSFGSGTSFVNSKVRIEVGPGSTISGYPMFKRGDLSGQVEAKENLAASLLFRSKVRLESDKVILEYTLPGISFVDVGLYLANGKVVQKRRLGARREGTYLEAFDGIPSGAIYFLHIKAGKNTATHRIFR